MHHSTELSLPTYMSDLRFVLTVLERGEGVTCLYLKNQKTYSIRREMAFLDFQLMLDTNDT